MKGYGCAVLLFIGVLTAPMAEACQLYRDVIQDVKGNAIVGASVVINVAGTSNLLTLYSDPLCAVTIPNPVTTDSTGTFAFWTPDAFVDLVPSKTGYTFATIENVPIFSPLGDNIVTVANYNQTLDICATGTGAIDQIGSTAVTLVINKAVTCTANKTLPSTLRLQFLGNGKISVSSGITLTLTAPDYVLASSTQLLFDGSGSVKFANGGTVYPGWWGAKGDNATDSTAAFQAALSSVTWVDPIYSFTGIVHVYVPPGSYLVTTSLTFPSASIHFQGAGKDITFIKTTGVTAFKITSNRTIGSVIEGFTCYGDGTATTGCFDTTPTISSDVVAKNTWRDLRIINYPRAFIIPNVQISAFLDLQVDGPTGGSVFYIHPGTDGLQSNANRVERLQVTGQDVQVWDVSLTSTQRAANWTLRDSDMHQTGTVAPITISDSDYLLENIEFENSSANHLVVLTGDNNWAAYHTTLSHLLLYGGAGGTNGKILSTTTGSQYAYYVTVINCDAGSDSDRLIDFTNGRVFTFLSNQGIISGDGNGFNFYGQNSDTFTSYTNGDTTPSVRGLQQLVITNSGGTTITDFDDGYDGQEVTLIFTDANTTLTDGGNLALAGGFTSTANDTLTVRRSGSTWYEVRRSVN